MSNSFRVDSSSRLSLGRGHTGTRTRVTDATHCWATACFLGNENSAPDLRAAHHLYDHLLI